VNFGKIINARACGAHPSALRLAAATIILRRILISPLHSSEYGLDGNLNFSLLPAIQAIKGIVLLFTKLPNALQHDRRTECKVSLLYCAYALQDSPAAASHRNRI
jgi:hypothetical protein